MKNKLLFFSMLLPFAAFANDTVTFYGEVADTTCNVTVNGVSGAVTVQLPTVATTELSSSSTVAGTTPFNFTVSGCSAASDVTPTQVGMRLLPISTANSGNLLNVAATNPASNVVVQLVDNGTGGPKTIDFSLGEYTSILQSKPGDNTGTLTFPFSAQYYATGQATAGKVQSQIQYALTYK
ncbi:fimbrial protein [Providencia rettgeri]